MKLSTARRLVCMSYFMVPGIAEVLATATRIVHNGDTKRFLFPDGSVIESNKGHWKVIGMKKSFKLEAAERRFGNGQKLPNPPFITGGYTGEPKDEVAGVVAPGAYTFAGTDAERLAWLNSGTNLTFEAWLRVGDSSPTKAVTNSAQLQMRVDLMPNSPTREQVLECEVKALQELCNEKDEQLDAACRPMVVRLDWWAVALVGLVLIAHYGFKVL